MPPGHDGTEPGRSVRVVSQVWWKKRSGAFFRLVKCTTNAPPCRAATGGTRHGQGYQGGSAGAGAEPVSLSELIHQHVRAAIETAVHEELRAALGTSPYERRDVRRGRAGRSGCARSTAGGRSARC